MAFFFGDPVFFDFLAIFLIGDDFLGDLLVAVAAAFFAAFLIMIGAVDVACVREAAAILLIPLMGFFALGAALFLGAAFFFGDPEEAAMAGLAS